MTSLSPAAALAEIWSIGRGDAAALEWVAMTGKELPLPSSFAVGTMAQATIAASALAAAELHRLRTGIRQTVHVDMRHAAVEFRSERYLRCESAPQRGWDKVAGIYRTGDGRFVRLHTNFPHHRAGMLALLKAEYERESVAKSLRNWEGPAFETAVAEAGLVATMMRSPEEWHAHPQGAAVARLPLFELTRIGKLRRALASPPTARWRASGCWI